jgi:hypothetical protein
MSMKELLGNLLPNASRSSCKRKPAEAPTHLLRFGVRRHTHHPVARFCMGSKSHQCS